MKRTAAWAVCAVLLAGCASVGVRSTGTSTAVGGSSGGAGTTTLLPVSAAPDDTAGPSTSGPSTSGPSTSGPGRPAPTAGSVDAPDAARPDPDGIGDVLFPELGNPGLDVQHYDVDLTYDHSEEALAGVVGLDVRFTERRTEFTLDSLGPQIDGVQIDGRAVPFRQDGPELRITPDAPIDRGATRRVDVRYRLAGDSHPPTDGLPVGWFDTKAGSYVLNEPDGARAWLPSNDHPSDKATYTFTIHVPKGVTAVANGTMTDHSSTANGDTWTWRESQPMATYLIQLLTGDYELIDGTGPHGLPLSSAVLRSDAAIAQPYINGISGQIEFFERFFGPYPLSSYGIAIADSFPGLAMETQGRSLFSDRDLDGRDNELVLAHELAHQWFGDAVTPQRWKDIWLNESFATYGQWMWLEHLGRGTVRRSAEAALSSGQDGATGDPTLAQMFGATVYDGGAAALEALRLTIGDDTFFRVLQQWVAKYSGTSRTTADFIALAEKISGRDLTDFFDTWIFADTKPPDLPTALPTTAPTAAPTELSAGIAAS